MASSITILSLAILATILMVSVYAVDYPECVEEDGECIKDAMIAAVQSGACSGCLDQKAGCKAAQKEYLKEHNSDNLKEMKEIFDREEVEEEQRGQVMRDFVQKSKVCYGMMKSCCMGGECTKKG
ncbi:hypothetical protein CHUAL_011269 [Chamberlinius hualienensis]